MEQNCPWAGARVTIEYPVSAHLILPHAGSFEDDDIIHVEGDVNPVRDLEIIHDELRLKVRCF